MNPQEILTQSNTLGVVSLTISQEPEYKQLHRQIRDGILLAVAGKVNTLPTPNTWRVKGHVVTLSGNPARWVCGCEQGASYGPVFGDFCGYPGRVYKHITSVSIILTSAVDNPPLLPRCKSILELVTRLAQVPLVVLFDGSNEVVLPTGLPTDIKLVLDSGDTLILKAGRAKSGALADVVEGRARMSPDAITNYAKFYTEIQARGIVPQPALQILDVQP